MNFFVRVKEPVFLSFNSTIFFKVKILVKVLCQRTLARVLLIKTRYPHRLVFIAGLPKSGTTWLENLVGAIPGYRRLVCYDLNNKLLSHQLDPAVVEVLPSRGNFFTKTHIEASLEGVEALEKNNVPTVIMVRDLRDQCVSRFYHVLNDSNHRHHEFYSYGNRSDAFSHCIEVALDEYLLWINGWLEVANNNNKLFLIVRYEDLYSAPKCQFKKVLSHFGVVLAGETIDKIIASVRISSRKGKDLKDRLKTHKNTLRQGGSGSWKKHFSLSDVANFKLRASQQLIELGYESDDQW
jgi:hypothetical protein